MPKLSIIVPIYNVEQYIEHCARSLFEQTLDDIEYIFVNDCSPDNSVYILTDVLKDYPHRIPYVKIINHSVNSGLTKTRNTGLSIAKGDYIAHCDSDDWVDTDMYSRLYNKAVETNSEIVFSDFYFAYKERVEVYRAADYDKDKKKLIQNYISSVWTSLCNMIVKRTIYDNYNLRAPEHISYCEDFWLSVRLFLYSEKTTKISEPFYYYNQHNETSIMHNLMNYSGDDMRCYLETIDLFINEGLIDDFQEVLSWRVLNAFHFDMYHPEKHKEIITIYPASHKYILSCPFYTKKQKALMWLLTHHCRVLVLLFLKLRHLLGRSEI